MRCDYIISFLYNVLLINNVIVHNHFKLYTINNNKLYCINKTKIKNAILNCKYICDTMRNFLKNINKCVFRFTVEYAAF